MKTLIKIVSISLIVAAGATFAQEKTAAPMDHSKMMETPAKFNIEPAAKDAVSAVDRFNNALKAGQFDKAGAELDANVLILESGGIERSAAEYLGGHAIGDAAFLKGVHVQLMSRTARANSDMAWVGSVSELHTKKDGKMITILSTESVVLKRTDKTWKIVHIHWSSRTKKADGSH
jgi:hypothetical protein